MNTNEHSGEALATYKANTESVSFDRLITYYNDIAHDLKDMWRRLQDMQQGGGKLGEWALHSLLTLTAETLASYTIECKAIKDFKIDKAMTEGDAAVNLLILDELIEAVKDEVLEGNFDHWHPYDDRHSLKGDCANLFEDIARN